jgi:hypothetical protein
VNKALPSHLMILSKDAILNVCMQKFEDVVTPNASFCPEEKKTNGSTKYPVGNIHTRDNAQLITN